MTFLRVLGRILLVFVLLLAACYAWAYVASNSKVNHVYAVKASPPAMPSDSASIREGERLASVYGCQGCHGDRLEGKILINDGAFGRFVCPNLTKGSGGAGATLKPEDWDRAVRGGVKPDGKPVLIMPCGDFHFMSDRDLGCILAYIQTVPDQSSSLPANAPGPIARILLATGALKPGVDKIDPATPPANVPIGPTAEFGQYVSLACRECHGANLGGGEAHGGTAPPNLTRGGALATWKYEDFEKALRHGLTPEGKKLDPEAMPWVYFSKMTDTEVQALWAHLQAIPPVAAKKS